MLVSEQTNSSPVKKNSTFMETVQDKLKDIKNFSNWSAKEKMIAVGAVGMMVGPLVLFVAAALPFAATGAIVALTLFFAVKAVEYTFKGLKWSAEKTVDGAKYIGGKIKDGAVHAKDKVKEGYENTVDSLKRGASFVGEGVANKFHKASGETDYLDKIKRFAPDEIKKSDEIKNDMKAIFADKGNNSGLVKNILSGISSKIDLKIAEEAKSGWEEYTPKWQVQKEFINNLNKKSLHSLLTQRSLPKGSYFIDSVFSEHHDEIKEVIKECKESHLYSSVSNMFNKAEKRADRPSFKSLTRSISSSLSSLGRKDSTQSTSSLSESSSMSSLDSVRTDSTISSEAELLNPAKHKKVKQSSGFFSRFKRNEPLKEATDIKYQAFSEPDTSSRQVGESAFYVAPPKPPRSNSLNSIGTVSTATVSSSGSKDFATVSPNRLSRSSSFSGYDSPKLTPVDPPKLSRSSSTDSGFNSSTSSPAYIVLTNEDGKGKTQADLNPTSHTLWEKPSTKVDEVKPESTQVKTVG
ncbi:MAG: hypothetical protein ACEY3B_03305 [Wolbachia sp.]